MDRRKRIISFIKKTEPILTVVIWSSVIFYFSSISGLKSDFKDIFDLILRKTAHILEYIVLVLLCFRAADKVVFKNKKHALVGAFVFTFLYAVSDEIHQLFVLDREGKIIDLVVDGIGIMVGLVFLYKFKKDNK